MSGRHAPSGARGTPGVPSDPERADPERADLERVDALNHAAAALVGTDDARALELARSAGRLARNLGSPGGEARALLTRALVHVGQDDLTAAQKVLRRLDAPRLGALGPTDRILAHEHLARIALRQGLLAEAREQLQAALPLASGGGSSEARLLNLLAGVHHASGELAAALDCLQAAVRLHRTLGDRTGEANGLTNIGNILSGQGEYGAALEALVEAHAIFRDALDDPHARGVTLINLGNLFLDLGQPPAAREYFAEALDVARGRHDHLMEIVALLNLGTALQKGDDPAAEQTLRSALDLSRRAQYSQGEVSALDSLGTLLAARGDADGAVTMHREALHRARDTEDTSGELDALLSLGRLLADLARHDEALTMLERALTLAEASDRRKVVFETHLLLSGVHKRLGAYDRALAHHELFHQQERALFNEESDRKVHELTARFEVQRARHDAEQQRGQREMAEHAREEAEARVGQRTAELERAQLEVVTRLAVAAEYRDDMTGEHTWRVGHFSALIARELELPEEDVDLLRTAARLHDVGKIGIPDAILLKEGRLTPEEYERMKTHTLIGARILSGGQSRLLRMAEEIALSHHERWDGQGYPFGRMGEAIPLVGRVVAIADVFDALTQKRPYKPAWPLESALAEIERQAGLQFAPDVVLTALRVLRRAEVRALVEGAATPH